MSRSKPLIDALCQMPSTISALRGMPKDCSVVLTTVSSSKAKVGSSRRILEVYGAKLRRRQLEVGLEMGGKRWTDIGKRYTRTRLGRLEPFLFPGNLCRVRVSQLRIKAVLYSTKSISI